MTNVIDSFYVDGVHSELSNFYVSNTVVDGLMYQTMEHYFQAMKTVDLTAREYIRGSSSPGVAKRAGRACDLRGDWEAIKLGVMRRGLMHKFDLHTPEGEFLLETGDAMLIEGNTWGDRYWGAVNGQGENWLGCLLMARRAELRYLRNA